MISLCAGETNSFLPCVNFLNIYVNVLLSYYFMASCGLCKRQGKIRVMGGGGGDDDGASKDF
jgi:hypothetical protein